MRHFETLTLLSLWIALAVWTLGCAPPPPEDLGDDDDDDVADDDAADDDAGDDDAGDDDAGDDDAGDDDAGDDDAGDDDAGDDDAGDDDAGDDDAGDDDSGPSTSIYDLQGGQVVDQTIVHLLDVVVTSPVGPNTPGFFVQELGSESNPVHSGIWIYIEDATAHTQLSGILAVNDRVEVTGLYQEYFGNSEIKITVASAVQVVGSGTVAPTVVFANEIATGGAAQEDYEGVLVRVESVAVSDDNPDAPKDFGEFVVNGSLRVDDVFFDAQPSLNDVYSSITGPMFYSYGNAKLEPRSAADLVP
jgi:hypothetical protein